MSCICWDEEKKSTSILKVEPSKTRPFQTKTKGPILGSRNMRHQWHFVNFNDHKNFFHRDRNFGLFPISAFEKNVVKFSPEKKNTKNPAHPRKRTTGHQVPSFVGRFQFSRVMFDGGWNPDQVFIYVEKEGRFLP